MNQVSESQEDDNKNNDLVTDLEKLEENLWRNGDDDGQLSDGQKERDDKDDFLNDDDIEEIVFFQTQALKMKGSVGGESLEEKDEKFLPGQTEKENTSAAGEVSIVVNNNTRDEESRCNSLEDRNSTRDTCISTCELGPVSEQPQNHVEGRHDKTKLDVREHNEVVKELSDNEELPGDYGDCVMEFELEYNEHSPGMSKESFSDKYGKNVDDFKDVSDLDAIHETLSDFQPHGNEDLDVPYESAHKRADCLSPPSGEGLWDIDETLQGSTREVTVLDDDEVDGKVADESITLLSDNDEEVSYSSGVLNFIVTFESSYLTSGTQIENSTSESKGTKQYFLPVMIS